MLSIAGTYLWLDNTREERGLDKRIKEMIQNTVKPVSDLNSNHRRNPYSYGMRYVRVYNLPKNEKYYGLGKWR